MIDGEGTVYIGLEDFWQWVHENYVGSTGDLILFGVPRINKENQEIEITYAFSSDVPPDDWVNPPVAKKEWETL